MGFGVFFGNAVQSGLNTYSTITRMKHDQQDQDAKQAERARADADRELAKKTLGLAGTSKMEANPETAETEAVGLGFKQTPYTRGQAYEDYARGVSDPKQAVGYAQLADAEMTKEKVKAIMASAQKWGDDPHGAIAGMSQFVPEGFAAQPVDVGGKMHVGFVEKGTGKLTVYDASTPQLQNMFTLKALATADPTTYMPMFQKAMADFTDTQRQNMQINQTGEHQRGTLKVAQQNANQSGAYQQGMLGISQQNADTAQQNADQTGQYQSDTTDLYRQGLRGGRGAGAGVDPGKQYKLDAAQRKEAIESAGGYWKMPNEMGQPVEHPAAKTLVSQLVSHTNPEVMEQVMAGVYGQAAQAATNPETGLVDQAKFQALYNAGVNQAMLALNQRMRAGNGAGAPAAAGAPPEQAASGLQRSAAPQRKIPDAKPKQRVPEGPTTPETERKYREAHGKRTSGGLIKQ